MVQRPPLTSVGGQLAAHPASSQLAPVPPLPYERLVPVGQRPNFPAHTCKQLCALTGATRRCNSPLNMAPAYPGAHQASCPPGGYTSSEWVSGQQPSGDRSSPAASAAPAAAHHLAAEAPATQQAVCPSPCIPAMPLCLQPATLTHIRSRAGSSSRVDRHPTATQLPQLAQCRRTSHRPRRARRPPSWPTG